jgi:hypothetical protein
MPLTASSPYWAVILLAAALGHCPAVLRFRLRLDAGIAELPFGVRSARDGSPPEAIPPIATLSEALHQYLFLQTF